MMQEPLEIAPEQPRVARHLAIGTLLATAAQVGPLAASAAMSLAIARLYGPTATGVMSLVMNLFDVVLMVFTLGLSAGITYLVSRGDWSLPRAARETRRAAAALGVSGCICGLAFWALTRHTALRGVTLTFAIVPLVSLPFALAWAFAAAATLGRDRYEAYASLEICYSIVILFGGVTLAILFGLTGAVVAFAAANVVTATLGALWIRRETRREGEAPPRDNGPHQPQLGRATRFGLQTWTANLLQLLNYRLDIFVLGYVATRSAVGVYSIAVSVTALAWILPNAFQTVLFPRVASLNASAGKGHITSESSDAAAARAIRHSVLIVLPTACTVAVLLLTIPLIYGSKFQHSVILGMILIPGVTVSGIAKVASAVTSGRGFPRYALYTTLATVPSTVILYIVLIPQFHAVGAAAASSLSYLLTTALTVMYFRKATGIPFRAALVPGGSDIDDYFSALRGARKRLSRA